MSGKPQVVYLVYREGLAAVIPSTAMVPMGQLLRDGYPVEFLFLSALGEFVRPGLRRRWRRRMETFRQIFPGSISRLPSPPARMRRSWDERRLVERWFSRKYETGLPIILHARNAQAAGLALDLRTKRESVKVVYDMRGMAAAEAASEDSSSGLHFTEERALRESDAVICVSQAMKRLVGRRVDGVMEKILVVPNGVDFKPYENASANREAMRGALGVGDKLVLTYCGSARWWQEVGASARLFLAVKKVEPSAHYLVLTPDRNRMLAALRQEGLADQNLTVMTKPPEEVAATLVAGDVGLLLRRTSVVNQVASPTKFAEYLASGVPVIVSEGVGDYSRMVQKQDVGLVLETNAPGEERESQLEDFVQRIKDERDAYDRRCRHTAGEHLSWTVVLPRLAALYDRLGAESDVTT